MAANARVLPAKPGELKTTPETPDRPRKPKKAKPRKRARGNRGPGRRIDISVYELIVEGYRRYPGNHSQAAQLAGVALKTAQRVWEYGLGAAYAFGQRPIKAIIEEEQTLARAELHRRQNAERAAAEDRARRAADPTGLASLELPASTAEAARRDAIDARAAEAAVVRGNRANVRLLTGVTTRLLRGVNDFAKSLQERIADDKEMPVDKGVLLIKRVAETVRTVAQAGDLVLEMERKLLGDSDKTPDDSTMSLAEAMETIRSSHDALERAEAMGLTVHEGGKGRHRPGQLPSWDDAPGGAAVAPDGEPLVPDYESFEGEGELGDPLAAPSVAMADEVEGEPEELPVDDPTAW